MTNGRTICLNPKLSVESVKIYVCNRVFKIKFLSEEKVEKDCKISALVKDLGENREHLEATKSEEGQ